MSSNTNIEYPLIENLNVDPRFVASSALLMPMPQFVSSQRQKMMINNVNQSLVIKGSEPPCVSSGFEYEFSKYTFNPTRFDQDAKILEVIPKYRSHTGTDPIENTPKYTVIYLGLDDDKIHSMEVSTYSSLTGGFGYEVIIDKSKLQKDRFMEKGDFIGHSSSVQGNKYNLGTNANVAFLSMPETVYDAFAVSDTFADKLESDGYKTIVIPIEKSMIPLNLYGDEENYKFFPDIGTKIRDDAVICGFRSVSNSVITDFNKTALKKYQLHHDTLMFSEHDEATVVDVDVRVNPSKKVRTAENIFSQIRKYEFETDHYYRRILNLYKEYCLDGKFSLGSTFNTLVVRAGSYLLARGERVYGINKKISPKFSRKSEPISFIELVITYHFKNKISNGNKVTGRDGALRL